MNKMFRQTQTWATQEDCQCGKVKANSESQHPSNLLMGKRGYLSKPHYI